MFKNLKVRQLIIFSISILLFMMVAMGLSAISNCRGLAYTTEQLFDKPHTKLVDMWTLKAVVAQTGASLKDSYYGNLPVSEAIVGNIKEVPALVRKIEGNKLEMNTDTDSAMTDVINSCDEWSKSAQGIVDLVNQSKAYGVSIEMYKRYLQHETSLLEKVDKIIVSASQNALNFKISAREKANQASSLLVAIFAVSVLLSVCVLAVILKNISVPIRRIIQTAKMIAKGNLQTPVDYESTNEFGQLAATFYEMQNYLKDVVSDIDYLLNEVGDGNFDVKPKINYVGDFASISQSVNNIVENLSNTMAQINESANQVENGSFQVSNGAQALSQGTTQQASSIEELSATISDISHQVKENARNSVEASQKANMVGDEMEQSNQQMKEMIISITEINNTSTEIGKIIKAIEDIAFQTNILALNAAVEAARAGAAGKGFAVVADEVRNLASKSAEASKNTAIMIENSVQAVERGTKIADETAKTLILAVNSAKEVAATINKISNASKDQSGSIEQITQGIDQISSVIQNNSATAQESAASSEELSAQAQMLKKMVDRFKLKSGHKQGLDFIKYDF